MSWVNASCGVGWSRVARGQLPGSSAMAPGQGLVAGDGGAFGQVAARGGGWCSRSCPFPKGCGVGEGTRGPDGGAPGAGRRAISLPWSQVRALIAPSGSARMRRVRAPAPGRAHPAPGEGPPGRGSRWCARPGSPIALAPLLADDQAAPSQFPGTTRSSIVRAPTRSTACPRPGGLTTRRMGVHFCAPRRRGQHDPVLLRGSSSTMACGSTCEVASWLIVRPPAAGEPAHGAPPPPRAPGLEAPADPAGRAHPGDRARHGPGQQGRHRGRAPWDGRAATRPASPPL